MKILPDAVLRYAIALFAGIPHPELRQKGTIVAPNPQQFGK
jgi:hypothetical protein